LIVPARGRSGNRDQDQLRDVNPHWIVFLEVMGEEERAHPRCCMLHKRIRFHPSATSRESLGGVDTGS
jgi:hypothetical protein